MFIMCINYYHCVTNNLWENKIPTLPIKYRYSLVFIYKENCIFIYNSNTSNFKYPINVIYKVEIKVILYSLNALKKKI